MQLESLNFVVGGVRVTLNCVDVFVPVLLGLAVSTIIAVHEIHFLVPHEGVDAFAGRQLVFALAFRIALEEDER